MRAQRLGAGSVLCSPPTVGQPRQARPRGVQGGAAAVAAARQRADQTRQRATEALQRLHTTGQPITFTHVARTAGVSRSWLYRQPDLRADIDRLHRVATAQAVPVPSPQRGSTESLRQRLEAACPRRDHQTQSRQPPTPRTPRPTPRSPAATTASPRRQRHVSHMKPKLRTTTASSPPDKNQQPAPSPATHRPRLHQPTQLRSPRHPRDIITPTGASNPQSHCDAKGLQDSVHEESGSAGIVASQRPRPSNRHPHAHTHQPSGHPAPTADPTSPSVDSG